MIGDILQPTHLIFILLVALLVLGPKRLPEVGRSLGKGLRDFRGAMSGIEDHTTGLFSDEPAAAATATTAPPQEPVQTSPAATTELATVAVAPVAATAVSSPSPVTATPTAPVTVSEPDPSEYAD
jgi:sec-independent protein translocase protein TatA